MPIDVQRRVREASSRDSIFIYLMDAKLEVIDELLADLKAA
jgi:hypothetical protein